jgi:hypothetical protein
LWDEMRAEVLRGIDELSRHDRRPMDDEDA